jgi:hypothetical protein
MHNWVGQSITLEEIFPGGGVKLVGVGPATVPGPGKSAHLRLSPEAPKGDPKISLFIQRYMQFPALDDREALTLPGRGLGDGAPPIIVWRRGGLTCFLVSNSREGIEVLRQALGAGEPKKPY